MCATMALFTPHFRGFGPGSSALLAITSSSSYETKNEMEYRCCGSAPLRETRPA